MRSRWPVMATFVSLGLGFVAYPYVTLFRLASAIHDADSATLLTLVNWHAVREGIKEDLCDMVLDEPAGGRPANELPPFGSGFVRGVTGNIIDQNITPEALLAAAQPVSVLPAAETPGANVRIGWAFFESPTAFSVSLIAPGQAQPIRLMMELHYGRWQVRRVWLPTDLLEHANSKT